MSRRLIIRYLNPWKARREQRELRLAELRNRDGDNCRRCRRPMRFDVPAGHDQGAKIEQIQPGHSSGTIDNLCLTHARCNASGADHTGEVTERIRRRSEAALLSRPRKRAGSRSLAEGAPRCCARRSRITSRAADGSTPRNRG